MAKKQTLLTVETLTHEESTRKNIPTAEYQSVMDEGMKTPIRLAYERRNRDRDTVIIGIALQQAERTGNIAADMLKGERAPHGRGHAERKEAGGCLAGEVGKYGHHARPVVPANRPTKWRRFLSGGPSL